MSTIAAFQDFMLATRDHPLTGIDQIQNEATKYQTYFYRRMLDGLAKEKYLQSGKDIVDYIQLSIQSSYQDYFPTQDFEFQTDNSLVQITVPWKFSIVSTVWYDHEIELNNGGDQVDVFKRIKKVKEQAMMTSLWEGMEDSLWALPDVTQMEGGTTTGKRPYSLRAFVTDDGGAPTSTNGGVNGADWTTVMGQSPTTFPNWKNQTESYDSTSAATRRGSTSNGIVQAMDRLWLDVQFQSPESAQAYAQDTKLNKLTIATNKEGITTAVDIANNRNDRILPGEAANDLGYANGRVTFHGLPMDYVAALNTVDSVAGKPKYRFLNFNYLYPIFHSKRYMFAKDLPQNTKQPFANGMLRDTWRNLWCASRRRQGIVIGA